MTATLPERPSRHTRFVEPPEQADAIPLERAFAKIMDALDYYQRALGLTDSQIVAATLLYRASKSMITDVAATVAIGDLPKAFQDGVSLEFIRSRTGLTPSRIQRLLAVDEARKEVETAAARVREAQERETQIKAHIAAQRLREAYELGASTPEIAAGVGCLPEWVQVQLTQDGTKMRTLAEAKAMARKRSDDGTNALRKAEIRALLAAGELAAAYKAGASLRQIERATGRSRGWAVARLRSQGVEIREPRGGRRQRPPRAA